MPRYKVIIEYDGTGYAGFQMQKGVPSIQEAVTAAVKKLSGEDIVITASGRTDAGVHAMAQTIHFDLTRVWDGFKLKEGMNAYLANSGIAVLDAKEAPDDFNARTCAKRKTYRYVIVNRRAPPALMSGRAWHVRVPLDEGLMRQGAQCFLGTHDFSSFRASECQAKSPIRGVESFTVAREGEVITFTVTARSFLHHQVRNMVGTLKLVGEGKIPPGAISDILKACDRRKAGPTAPSYGLYMVSVEY